MTTWFNPTPSGKTPSSNALVARFSFRNRLYRVLRRWHGRSTHQRFALDALPLVQTVKGHRLVTLLLRHYDRYLTGAIDPDIRFRDFQNHVIHVCQGYWGGAPRIAHRWYDRLLRHLNEERYGEAAHAAGVLSHYFVDPLQPLHTMQCDRGRVIHRPLERSITKSYDDILRLWIEDDLRIVFQLSDHPGWLGDAILHNARYAHRQYNRVVNDFDLEASVKRPERGLNDQALSTLSGLFGLSITGWARVLERAAHDAEALKRRPLRVPHLMPSYLSATLRVPTKAWYNRIESNIQQIEIEQLVAEYDRQGKLVRYLPPEVDIFDRVSEVYADEQLYQLRKNGGRRKNGGSTIPFVEDPATPDSTDRRAA